MSKRGRKKTSKDILLNNNHNNQFNMFGYICINIHLYVFNRKNKQIKEERESLLQLKEKEQRQRRE